eukprot:gene20119-26849_t
MSDSPEQEQKQGGISGGIRLISAVQYLPHPDKVHYGGEDAHFTTDHGAGAIGVSDGVGGWAESGVNPADYSRSLMTLSCAYIEGREPFEEESKAREPGLYINPRGALHAAHMGTKLPGSATACVLQLDPESSSIVAANLGDSGFILVRNKSIVMKSKPLQHYFDCPLQFGAFPEFVEATDTADMAEFYNVPVQPGDVIVAGSDGLWDNCFDYEITELCPSSTQDLQESADRIGNLARAHAADNKFQSPYSKEALAQGLDLNWWEKLLGTTWREGRFHMKQLTGGKMDDITVIVAMVDGESTSGSTKAE